MRGFKQFVTMPVRRLESLELNESWQDSFNAFFASLAWAIPGATVRAARDAWTTAVNMTGGDPKKVLYQWAKVIGTGALFAAGGPAALLASPYYLRAVKDTYKSFSNHEAPFSRWWDESAVHRSSD